MKRVQIIVVALMLIVVIAGLIINFVLAQRAEFNANKQEPYTEPTTISCDERVLPKLADQETEVLAWFSVNAVNRSERIKIWQGDELIYSCTNFDRDELTGVPNSSFTLPILKSGQAFRVEIESNDQVWARDIVPDNPKEWRKFNGETPEEFIVYVSVNDQGRLVVRQDHESPIYD